MTNLCQDQLKALMGLFSQQRFEQVFEQAQELTKQYSNNLTLWNLAGVSAVQLGYLDQAVIAFQSAININSGSADAHNNLGSVLIDQGNPEEAIKAFNEALAIKPDYAEAYYNMGNAFLDQDKLEEAEEAFEKSISFKADYVDAYNNLGNALRRQDKSEEAIKAFNKAILLKPNIAEIHNNIGVTYQDQGKLADARDAFKKALAINPRHADANLNLCRMIKYSPEDHHFLQVKTIYSEPSLNETLKCKLSFALAKMFEDVGEYKKAFGYLNEGNAMRRNHLKYSMSKDRNLFKGLKKAQIELFENTIKPKRKLSNVRPIFIVGMPRSGTTLVEQIISAHSMVYGAGELNHLKKFGFMLSSGFITPNQETISKFRGQYLHAVDRLAKGRSVITDKMPHNFRFIPLICAAFPEAKIVHVKRDPSATCWSNYKQFFSTNRLGYSYNLEDCVSYYKLYEDLMDLWKSIYKHRIYNLDYEQLTISKEFEIEQMIAYLGLNWEDVCLTPELNNRNVQTASNHQVRHQVYKNSSKEWRKFEPYLNGIFDCFNS